MFSTGTYLQGRRGLSRTIDFEVTGRWSVRGDTLFYTYVSDALDRIPAGATDRDRLLSVQREFFIIEAADGRKRKYLRIR
jgi:hypothetical protein